MAQLMASKTKSAVAGYRTRDGFERVEVISRKEDANLVRRVAAALSEPSHRTEVPELLLHRLAEPHKVSLKALLASAPLDGIDRGRDVDVPII